MLDTLAICKFSTLVCKCILRKNLIIYKILKLRYLNRFT